MAEHLAQFLDAQASAYSPHTLAAYRRDLTPLVQQLKAAPTATELQQFLAQRHKAGLAPRSLQRLRIAIRRFCQYLVQTGVIEQDPSLHLRAPKAPRLLPRSIDIERLQAFLDAPWDPDDPQQSRDQALLELLYGSGLRLGELIALNTSDWHPGRDRLIVQGKGQRQRQVPIGRRCQTAMTAWYQCRALWCRDAEENALFLGQQGRRLNPRTARRQLQQLAIERGLPEHLHPHRLRHAFASHLLASSGDLRGVQELLGHASLSSTQVYTALDFQHLARVYDHAHPRAHRDEHSPLVTGEDPCDPS